MTIIQKEQDSTYPLNFIIWSENYPIDKDVLSVGGWGRHPNHISRTIFKLEIIK